VIQELTNCFVKEKLANHPLTSERLSESETRKDLIRRHADMLSAEEQALLAASPYLAEFTDWVKEALSNRESSEKQIRRAIDHCKYTGLFTKAYVKETQKLNNLVDELYEKNSDQFTSREDVFNLFIQAVITGNVLPVGRIIEKSLVKAAFVALVKVKSF
jgi:hypothetical protein